LVRLSKRGHRPQRTCLGCGAQDDQDKLLRLAVTERGELIIAKEKSGRGGYLHRDGACWRGLLRKKGFYRAFHVEISKGATEKIVHELRTRWE